MESSKREGILKVVTDLKSLKKSGELDEDKYLVYQNLKWRNLLEYSILESCIKHRCPTIRLQALALISESKKTTQKYTSAELHLILIFLEYNIGERLEFLPFIKKILRRASDSLIVLQRQLMKEDMILECQKRSCNLHNSCAEPSSIINERIARINVSIESYDTFFSSLKDFCLNSLYPGAVHCRKHSALQILLLMQEFLKHDIISGLWNHSRADRLVQCLFVDTYESNKEVAFKIIKYIQPKVMNLDNKGTVCEIIDTALELANNMRPIDSITASFMLKMACLSPVIDHTLRNYIDPEGKFNSVAESTLLKMMLIIINRLKKPLELAKENIVLACSRHSLYGYIFCVRSLLNILDLRAIQDKDPWRKMITEIVYICFALSGIVSEVVNNSSPEGHLPMDLNIQNNHCLNNVHTSLVTSQMVLLCSWRTIKETSLLFGYLTSKCPLYISESYLGLLSEDQVITIGEHFVTSLCETKHRGAFEQAYVGFEQMCKQLWRSKEEGLQQLPLVWLHYLFLDISGLKNGNFKLCSTRRSAGVPFMVQAIVSSALQKNDNSNNSVFHSVMGILFGFCQLMDSETLFYDIQCIMYNKTIFCQFKSVCDIPYSGYEMTSKDMKHDSNLTEIKTHTLNILRALFKHSLLGDIVKEYISDGFKVAMRSYDGKSWAERNAATLLLGTLITRTFGVLRTKDHINLTVHNKMTGKAFFETHTGLLSLMLDKLYNFIKEDNELINSNIQPILLIASRLYPGNASEDRAEFIWESNHLMPMCRSDVHKLLMNNSWMCSSDLDCRVEIAKNLSDLYIEPVDLEKSCLILDWWTTLLNLLLDDNFTVRQNASKVICDVQCINNLECQFGIMRIFFEQFLNSVGKKSPAVGLAALITWSITLMEDRELEMDDTDVFNRCSNYECFEPLWIARKCSKIVHTIIKQYSADEMIPKIVRCWLSYRLNVELSNLTTFRELMTNYKNHIPNLKGRLRDILDPTYNSKLGQQASYKHLNKEFTNVL
ncbi:thyroid adenoma-associated protein isoform X10 [Belonocnema kinseyi]|uniref:thyroid adenoma-associated protein isoform X10 n=1 Tax=Belonocnema kinseyi TaxID=2817044 RepID=UPI00143DB809|nr:thyroid adenoma-associated protein isoform X10 [Belonocnema kinseyi]